MKGKRKDVIEWKVSGGSRVKVKRLWCLFSFFCNGHGTMYVIMVR